MNATAEKLKQYIDRIETLASQKQDIADDIRGVFAEAKSEGFDPKVMRETLKLRKMRPHEREEMEALLETYKAALMMG